MAAAKKKKKAGTPKRTKGEPRAPFRLVQDWVDFQFIVYASKDDKVRALIAPTIEGDLRLTVECGAWDGMEDAKRVAAFVLAPLLDEHGYAREIEDYDEEILELLEDVASTPMTVNIDPRLVELTEEEAKMLSDKQDDPSKKKGRRKKQSS